MTVLDVVVGVDLGTTTAKALVRTNGWDLAQQRDIADAEVPTVWSTYPDGRTETSAGQLLAAVLELLRQAVHQAELAVGAVRVRGIGFAGLAESGVLLDPAGRPAAPVMAWFDRRGQSQVEGVNAHDGGEFAAQFQAKTGLPWRCQASLAKLLWLRETDGCMARGSRWLSVPEWIVHVLGADQVREPSLASRTGLIDQNTGQVWPAALQLADLPDDLLPPVVFAGYPAGRLRHDDAPSHCAGAVLTVAGHDHPVAALGVGAVGPDELFNSSGTADVVARSVPGRLTDQQRQAIVAARWSAGQHVLPDSTLLIAGASGGLLLRRVLTALGCQADADRDQLDQASLGIGELPPGLRIDGDGRLGNGVQIRLSDDATPAAIWSAATRHTAAQTRAMLAAIEPVAGPHRRAIASGGWTRMASVRLAKAAAIENLSFSSVSQPGIAGAALLASYAVSDRCQPLIDFARDAQLSLPANF